ncbi:MAG: HAMP domain-containing histidine kinase [Lachnospiraceae bacterium]|nr:HAMP domain-containing histidine kinase [Lachnospiraceae bacterium]
MKISKYLRDKLTLILGTVFIIVAIFLMGYVFKVKKDYMIALAVVVVLVVLVYILSDYFKRRHFYKNMMSTLDSLDQKYLITDMLPVPDFQEGELMMEALYDIDKSMKERINDIELGAIEFREYLEMWVHEIKVPISALRLMNYNQNTDLRKQKEQIDRINYYIEQILFYARADESEKDYLMNKVSIETIINKIVMENKTLLIGNRIAIEKENVDATVITDSKWLEFMLSQILNNALKYTSEGRQSYIKFSVIKDEKQTLLSIEDNGIGISEKDLPYVFDKTFTGENGRVRAASTGMGLYICKKLCDKLGHRITIQSKQGEYTKVMIGFGNDNYYEV